jgi:hypothetical protein
LSLVCTAALLPVIYLSRLFSRTPPVPGALSRDTEAIKPPVSAVVNHRKQSGREHSSLTVIFSHI